MASDVDGTTGWCWGLALLQGVKEAPVEAGADDQLSNQDRVDDGRHVFHEEPEPTE